MRERNKLINQLEIILRKLEDTDCLGSIEIADFILSDRARIVEPLVKYTQEHPDCNYSTFSAISETLKRAGVE